MASELGSGPGDGNRRPSRRKRPRRAREHRAQLRKEMVLLAFERKARAAGLTPETLATVVLPRLSISRIDGDEEIITPGDTPDGVTIVGSGALKTVIRLEDGSQIVVQYAKPSQVVGFTPMAPGQTALRFGAVAHGDAVVATMSRDLLREVLGRATPEVRLLVVAYLCRALSRLLYDKCRLLVLEVPDRIIQEVVRLARDFPLPGVPGGIDLPLTHDDIAELVVAERSTVSRALKVLARPRLVMKHSATHRWRVAPHLLDRISVQPVPCVAASGLCLTDDEELRRHFKKAVAWGQVHMGLPFQAGRVLAEEAELRGYEPEDVIPVQDGVHATVLVAGTVRVDCPLPGGKTVGIWFAKPGHFIGSGWVGDHAARARAFRAVAHEPSIVAVLRPELLVRVIRELTIEQLLAFFGFCHQALSRQLYNKCVMRAMTVRQRLLFQLQVLATDFPAAHERGTLIDLGFSTRRDAAPRMLAPFIATTPSNLSRAFWELVDEGRVEFVGQRILMVGHFTSHAAA